MYYGQIILYPFHFLSDEINGSMEKVRAVIVLYLTFSVDFHICRRNWKKSGKYGEENILNEGRDWIWRLKSRWKMDGLVGFKRSGGWDLSGTCLEMVVFRVWYWIWDITICPWVTQMMVWDTAVIIRWMQSRLSEESQQLEGLGWLEPHEVQQEREVQSWYL